MGSEGSSTPIFVTIHVYCFWFGTFTSWGTALLGTTDEIHLTLLVCPIGFGLLEQFFQVRVFSVLVSFDSYQSKLLKFWQWVKLKRPLIQNTVPPA